MPPVLLSKLTNHGARGGLDEECLPASVQPSLSDDWAVAPFSSASVPTFLCQLPPTHPRDSICLTELIWKSEFTHSFPHEPHQGQEGLPVAPSVLLDRSNEPRLLPAHLPPKALALLRKCAKVHGCLCGTSQGLLPAQLWESHLPLSQLPCPCLRVDFYF